MGFGARARLAKSINNGKHHGIGFLVKSFVHDALQPISCPARAISTIPPDSQPGYKVIQPRATISTPPMAKLPLARHPLFRELVTREFVETFIVRGTFDHLGHLGLIADLNGKVIQDVWREGWTPLEAFSDHIHKVLNSEPIVIEEETISLCMPWIENYSHWMYQGLPRLKTLEMDGIDYKKFLILIPANAPRYVRESLSLLGISEANLRATDTERIRGSMIVCSPEETYVSPWALKFIRDNLLGVSSKRQFSEKLLLIRSDSVGRIILNKSCVQDVLERRGFEAIDPGTLSLPDQIAAFAAAKQVVSVHGAALTNIVFCAPGTRIVEIMPKHWIGPAYAYVAFRLGLDYRQLVGDEMGMPWPLSLNYRSKPSGYFRYGKADVQVNVAELKRALGE